MQTASTNEIRAEPNLVPLLDLVFQLIMFFMICVNFFSQQVNEEIKLPIAQSARPIERTKADVIFNVDQNGNLVPGRDQPLSSLLQQRVYVRRAIADAKRANEERGQAAARSRLVVIIRADRRMTYALFYKNVQLVKEIAKERDVEVEIREQAMILAG